MSADDETATGHGSDSETEGAQQRRSLALAGFVTFGIVVASLVPPALLFGSSSSGGAATGTVGPLGLVDLDKWLHAVGYAGLAGTLVPVFESTNPSRRAFARTVLFAVAVAVGIGVGVELLQWPHPGRTVSLADATANLVGAMGGAGVVVARRLLTARSRSR